MKKYVLSFCLCCLLIGTHIQATPQKYTVSTVSSIDVNRQAAPTTVNIIKVGSSVDVAAMKTGISKKNTVLLALHGYLVGGAVVSTYGSLLSWVFSKNYRLAFTGDGDITSLHGFTLHAIDAAIASFFAVNAFNYVKSKKTISILTAIAPILVSKGYEVLFINVIYPLIRASEPRAGAMGQAAEAME